jgi:hypothetical protein
MPMWRRRISRVVVLRSFGEWLARDQDRSLVRVLEPRNEVEQRRLAAARRPHEREERSPFDREVDAAQRPYGRDLGLEGLCARLAPRARDG